MEKLFYHHSLHLADPTPMTGEIGSSIIKQEVTYAMKTMKNSRSPGHEEVSIDLLKCINGGTHQYCSEVV